jgi:hypothetical protein
MIAAVTGHQTGTGPEGDRYGEPMRVIDGDRTRSVVKDGA